MYKYITSYILKVNWFHSYSVKDIIYYMTVSLQIKANVKICNKSNEPFYGINLRYKTEKQ